MVSIRNFERMANGYKLTIVFGNPLGISINRLRAKISWGPEIDFSQYFSDEKYKSDMGHKIGSKQFDVLSDLHPASWNEVPITIGPASEESIARITISDIEIEAVEMPTVRLPN
jgi:hypothetical protein